jgi:uncharacterized iron-regulated membrane protein
VPDPLPLRPPRGRLRRALFQVHLWAGLALAAYAVAISVSGSILVYGATLGARAHADWRAVAPASVEGRSVVTAGQAVALVGQALPGRTLLNVHVPAQPWQAHIVGLLDQTQYRVVFVHPLTGAVSPPVQARGAVIGWIERLHSNFFSGRSGRVANGVGGGLLVVLALTGLVIWWPGRGRVSRALRVDWGAGWKRVVFDLHHALGAWLLLPVLLLSVTGAYFTWPQAYRDVVGRFSPLTRRPAPRSTEPAGTGPTVDLDALVARVRAAEPERPWVRVDLPGGARSPYVLVASAEPESPGRDATMTFADRYSGQVLEVRRDGGARTRGDVVVEWLPPLHTGHFGGPVVHAVWALLGLAPAALAITGGLMWWNRVIVPRRRRGTARAGRA